MMHKRVFRFSLLILALASLAVFLLSGGCMLHTRSDKVEVTEVEGTYCVRISSTGFYYLMPISPEGPFPSWSDDSTFWTTGEGESDGQGGVVFIVGRNVESGWYSEGRLTILDGGSKIQLDAKLEDEFDYHTNHSGTYKAIFERPLIEPIAKFPDQKSMESRYIKAAGRFSGSNKFTSGQYVFMTQSVLDLKPGQDYVITGMVFEYISGQYGIEVYRASPANEGSPP